VLLFLSGRRANGRCRSPPVSCPPIALGAGRELPGEVVRSRGQQHERWTKALPRRESKRGFPALEGQALGRRLKVPSAFKNFRPGRRPARGSFHSPRLAQPGPRSLGERLVRQRRRPAPPADPRWEISRPPNLRRLGGAVRSCSGPSPGIGIGTVGSAGAGLLQRARPQRRFRYQIPGLGPPTRTARPPPNRRRFRRTRFPSRVSWWCGRRRWRTKRSP